VKGGVRLAIMNWARKLISEEARATITLRLFGLTTIPMLFYARPSVREISPERIVVRIPLRRRTRNHLGSMYFGALSVGADCAVGALAMHLIRRRPERISLIFSDFRAEFLKRAEGDVDFCCCQGHEISNLIAQAAVSDERVEMPVRVVATVPDQGNDSVATFKLTLSLKRRP
jgi:acyl-coenzyme A thioesterase PaaI-like protein